MSQATFKPAELRDDVKERGLDDQAWLRLEFRLLHIEEYLHNTSQALIRGNIASYEPEFIKVISAMGDLINVLREFLTLLHQEQGLISPPNAPKADEAPSGS